MIRFYDTPSRTKRPFEPIEPGRVRLYSCGPTVWDYSHIGNFRCFLFYDVLKRYLRYRGFEVVHVMNLTDIDDRIVERVGDSGGGLEEYVGPYIEAFFRELDDLGIEQADHYPRATDHIPEMVQLVEHLLGRGLAYVRDGSVYFSIASFPAYGEFAHLDIPGLRGGARIDSDRYDKEDVRDFVLWKGWTEPDGDLGWESPWGRGRPGWHLECSCMSMKYLGQTFDIHTGGIDLVFPHHQNEIAQSEGATGEPLSRYWMHNEFINIDGVKLSKSLGNQLLLRDLPGLVERSARSDVVPGFRYLVVTNHYRTTLSFTEEALAAGIRARRRLNRLYGRLRPLARQAAAEAEGRWVEPVAEAREGFIRHMDDDLNASPAMAAVFALASEAQKALSAGELTPAGARSVAGLIEEVDGVLGLLDKAEESAAASDAPELPPELGRLVQERQEARAARDWDRADALRRELAAAGVVVTDTPDGPRWTWERP